MMPGARLAQTLPFLAAIVAIPLCRPAEAQDAPKPSESPPAPASSEVDRPDGGSASEAPAMPGSAAPAQGPAPVDADLARAIERDQASAVQTQPPASAPSPAAPASPMAKLNPDISFILDVGFAWFTRADHPKQGGHSIDDNGIAVQGLELAASASVDPFFRFDLFAQLAEVEVEEAYLTTLSLPGNLQARAGWLNAAMGRQNPVHLHAWKFANPPLSHTRFMSEDHFRGPGAELSVLMPLPWYLTLAGQVLDTTEKLGFQSASFAASEQSRSGRIDGPEDFVYVLRMENFLELTTDWSLLLGANEGLGHSPYLPEGRASLHGGDVYLKWRPVSRARGDFALALTVEYLLRDCAAPGGRFRDHGGYAEIDAMLTRRWEVGLRFDNTALWKGPSPDPEKVPGWQRRGSASLTFLPTHFSKLRLQGDLGRDETRSGPSYAVFLQAEVSAGEHGAHNF